MLVILSIFTMAFGHALFKKFWISMVGFLMLVVMLLLVGFDVVRSDLKEPSVTMHELRNMASDIRTIYSLDSDILKGMMEVDDNHYKYEYLEVSTHELDNTIKNWLFYKPFVFEYKSFELIK